MRSISFLLAGLLLLAMISGCPASQEPNGESTVAGGAPDRSDDSTASAVVEFVESNLILDGIKVGLGSEEFMTRYAPETGAITRPMWAVEGELGIVQAVLDPEVGEPIETSFFMDSSLVGFTSAVSITYEDFNVVKAGIVEELGEPTDEPMVWAQESPFFEGAYQPVPDDMDSNFWCDEQARVMLTIIFSETDGMMSSMLIDVDRLSEATEATMEAMTPPEMGMPPMESAVPEGIGMPAEEVPEVSADEVTEDETAPEEEPEAPVEDETPAGE